MEKSFKMTYTPQYKYGDALKELINLKQGKDEHFAQYMGRFDTWISCISSEPDLSILKDALYKKMNPFL